MLTLTSSCLACTAGRTGNFLSVELTIVITAAWFWSGMISLFRCYNGTLFLLSEVRPLKVREPIHSRFCLCPIGEFQWSSGLKFA